MKIKYLLVAFVLLLGCNDKNNNTEKDFLTTSLEKLNLESKYDWVVVLPGLGCHGCIDVAEAFMKEHIDRKDILFVLTKIESLKILQQKLDIDVNDYSNIYIDREELFNVPTNNTIYPCIIELEKNEVKAHEFQSPENSTAFQKLRKRLLGKI